MGWQMAYKALCGVMLGGIVILRWYTESPQNNLSVIFGLTGQNGEVIIPVQFRF